MKETKQTIINKIILEMLEYQKNTGKNNSFSFSSELDVPKNIFISLKSKTKKDLKEKLEELKEINHLYYSKELQKSKMLNNEEHFNEYMSELDKYISKYEKKISLITFEYSTKLTSLLESIGSSFVINPMKKEMTLNNKYFLYLPSTNGTDIDFQKELVLEFKDKLNILSSFSLGWLGVTQENDKNTFFLNEIYKITSNKKFCLELESLLKQWNEKNQIKNIYYELLSIKGNPFDKNYNLIDYKKKFSL